MYKSFEQMRNDFANNIQNATDNELCIDMYLHRIGITYTQVNIMENDIIGAMIMCNKIRLKTVLGDDADRWAQLASKSDALYKSTLGSLITILSRHNIAEEDINYLKWVKARRDFFVHRFFHDGRWPDKIAPHHCVPLCRQLQYLQLVFFRASRKIMTIFVKNGLMARFDLGDAGYLTFNVGEDPFSGDAD